MAKRKKKKSKWLLFTIISIFLLIILTIIFLTTGFTAEETIWEKFDNYEDELMNCSLKVTEYLNVGKFDKANYEISNCKDLINNALIEINKLSRNEESRELKIAKLDYEMSNYQVDATRIIISLNQNDYTENEILEKIERAQFLLRSSLYNFYKIEKEYSDTQYYQRYYQSKKEEIEKGVDNIVSLHSQLNQEINSYYDVEYGWMTKYFLQVDPLDPIIVEKTEEISGFSYNQEDIKWALFNFVRTNVNYKYDPSWLTDWAQPPAITLLNQNGDCEDISILLASMFIRAGISDVELCSADVDGDSIYDHMFVAVGGTAWDGTYDGSETAPSEVKNWKQKCFNVNEVVQNPTSAQIIECSSGYVLGEDNLCHEPCGSGYCDEGVYCFNGQCISCPSGTYLATDGRCYNY